jgi:hypothetical protein
MIDSSNAAAVDSLPIVEIELVPDAGADDPASRAALAALAREGMVDDVRPIAYDGAWRRAGLEDAVEECVAPAVYVPPARSTPGATRA